MRFVIRRQYNSAWPEAAHSRLAGSSDSPMNTNDGQSRAPLELRAFIDGIPALAWSARAGRLPGIRQPATSRLQRSFTGPNLRRMEVDTSPGRRGRVRELVAGSPEFGEARADRTSSSSLRRRVSLVPDHRRRRSTTSKATSSAGMGSIPTSTIVSAPSRSYAKTKRNCARSRMPFASPSWSSRLMERHSTRTGWLWSITGTHRAAR